MPEQSFVCQAGDGRNHESLVYKKSKFLVEYTISRYPARTYGQKVRWRQLELGFEQVGLAKLLGADKMSVFNWENERHCPSGIYERKIKEVLGAEN